MSRKRMMRLITLVLFLIPVVALATDFYWTGGVGDFDDCNKWTGYPESAIRGLCYPHSCNDDATIWAATERAIVYITTETIDDLLLRPVWNQEVILDGQEEEKTLTCDTLTIVGPALAYVALYDGGIIKTQGCP